MLIEEKDTEVKLKTLLNIKCFLITRNMFYKIPSKAGVSVSFSLGATSALWLPSKGQM